MTRSISSALATELAKTITTVGYLVEIGLSSVRRWSTIGQVTWNSQTWLDVDFVIEGLSFDPDSPLTGTLTVQNLAAPAGESVRAAEIFLDSAVIPANVPVTVYQFAAGALAAGDVPNLAVMAIGGIEFSHQSVQIALEESKGAAAFSPRRRVNATNGFKFATPSDQVIVWENEIFVTSPPNG